ncbi:MAG: 3-hydroxyacyl-CoA dehydrogenase [Marmoricola sp.]|nr:3-hydroxyacyl-CoA dehydrogenase [Marmoricola sp.]
MSDSATQESAVKYDRGADGIVILTLDDPTASANTMNDLYKASMAEAIDRLYAEKDDVTGVVITSAKKTFFAGGNLKNMMSATREDADQIFALSQEIKKDLRRLETLGKPVVAAINGAALGGGLEIALATNHRIVVDKPKIEIGLPEVTLGLLPGGGGVTRIIRMFGIQSGLMDFLLQGPRFKPAAAKEKGLVDELVASTDDLVTAAKAWILENKDNPDAATQPWDRKGYKMPGGSPSSPALAGFLPAFPALLRKQTKGAMYPAPRAIMAAAIEGAQVDFETASTIESRYFTSLVTGQNAKNMIQSFFFDLSAIAGGSLRPADVPVFKPTKALVLGAGMMGAGIAYSCARAGIAVLLKDVSIEAAEKGKSYSDKLLGKAVERGKMTEEKKAEILGLITATADPADAAGCDLVIEAVFEDPALKAKVFAEIQDVVNADALLCSNTSTLPITELAEGVSRPADFIGLHFFSPVDKMPLVEIIKGAKTTDVAVAQALDVVTAIRKTPIVVNDSRGFYTSRVIGTMVMEGISMLGEGVHPMSIERAATQAGYPVGTLQLSDELNLELMAKIEKTAADAAAAAGESYVPHPATAIINKMIELGRSGRLRGAGFFDYDENGNRGDVWKGLTEIFPSNSEPADLEDLKDRYLFIETLETAKCFEEGVIESAAAANIGSIMGIGFPALTGGAAQFITGYEGKGGKGLTGYINRANELAARYGDRFKPTARLVEMAEKGESFPA